MRPVADVNFFFMRHGIFWPVWDTCPKHIVENGVLGASDKRPPFNP
jgi:hypothetical protein